MNKKIEQIILFDLRLAYYVKMGYHPRALNAMHNLRVAFLRTLNTEEKIEYYGIDAKGYMTEEEIGELR